jgi:hypothetical protein
MSTGVRFFIRWHSLRHPRELGRGIPHVLKIAAGTTLSPLDRFEPIATPAPLREPAPALYGRPNIVAPQQNYVYSSASLWWPKAVAASSVHRR